MSSTLVACRGETAWAGRYQEVRGVVFAVERDAVAVEECELWDWAES